MVETWTLGIDVGTSSTKVILLNEESEWDMHVWPSSEGVWNNLKQWLDGRTENIIRVGITGHGPSAIVIRDGALCGRMIQWNESIPESCERPTFGDQILSPSRSWVPSRLAQWELENGPIGNGVVVQLKDFLNWELTGVIARDSRSMRGYVGEGHFHLPEDVIGTITETGSRLSGIPEGVEVICGCDDLTAGVLGLGAPDGCLFNLANTSEHIGLVGGKPQENMSWLPPIGRLPSLCYTVTPIDAGMVMPEWVGKQPTREDVDRFISTLESEELRGNFGEAWSVLNQINLPIEEMKAQFPDGEMWIGGGLAVIPQLVASRNAILKAKQEVSVLGVARLAQKRPHAIIFGAGKVGRGFLAQLLTRSGWDFSLVDAHLPTIQHLRKEKVWSVYNLSTKTDERLQAKYILHLEEQLDELMLGADLVLTAMGAKNIEAWADYIRQPLCERLKRGVLDVVLAENHPNPASSVRQALQHGASNEELELIEQSLGISQAQVLRSCIEPTNEQHPLTIQVQDHWTLPLDGDALLSEVQITGFEPKSNFDRELTRKLFTYNCVNAMVCYIGHLAGFEWLADAANHPEISQLALAAGRESSAALVAAYGFDEAEQNEWCERALAKYQDSTILDPIERNARDPIRKLGENERLLGPIKLCIEHQLPCDSLLVGVAAALKYPNAKIDFSLPLGEAEAKLESLLASESIS
ncbi:MAG: hypothetical protein VX627_06860 [Candidatus Thermoplasmatota archaeon]|nr:hypothetical protein [Candidatus Thermoplasmatota archaeon]